MPENETFFWHELVTTDQAGCGHFKPSSSIVDTTRRVTVALGSCSPPSGGATP